jgi:hypothetical protein
MDLRSHDFSTMGIATGTTVPDDLQSCTIDIPANLATGSRELQVIAYGIASDPVAVQVAADPCLLLERKAAALQDEINNDEELLNAPDTLPWQRAQLEQDLKRLRPESARGGSGGGVSTSQPQTLRLPMDGRPPAIGRWGDQRRDHPKPVVLVVCVDCRPENIF